MRRLFACRGAALPRARMRVPGRRAVAGGVLSLLEGADEAVPRGLDCGTVNAPLVPPRACRHCGEAVAHAGQLWTCVQCGAYRSPQCRSQARHACPECGHPARVLGLPNREKTQLGIKMLRDASPGLFIRMAAHAVGFDGLTSFRAANKLLRESKDEEALPRYAYAVQCLNWIRLATPEFYHACGFDGDLVRALVLRQKARGQTTDVWHAAHADLFCGQDLLELPASAALEKTPRSAKAKISSLFVNWTEVPAMEENPPSPWTRSSDKIVWIPDAGKRDKVFAECGGLFHASDRWSRKNGSLADFKWGFASDYDAARFLSRKYDMLSQNLPLMENVLSVGTDCLGYGGMGLLDTGQSDARVIYLFRERNVVVKFMFSQRGLKNPPKAVMDKLFYETRSLAYSYAMVSRLLLEQSEYTQPKSDSGFFSKFFKR